MLKIIANLEALGLSSTEAQVYIAVLQKPNVNGSQLTKQINLPKPSVYLALDKLYQKGLINLIPGKSKQYIAQDINVAFQTLRNNFNHNLDSVLLDLQELQPQKSPDEFIHIDGYNNYLAQVKQMVKSATREIYLHSNSDLNILQTELLDALKRGVKIIIYSFGTPHVYDFGENVFFDQDKPATACGIRMLVVIDNCCCLSASGTLTGLLAIYTENKIQVDLVAENIHNAIYWLKLYKLHPNFDYPCRLETLAEQDIHISGYQI